MKKEDFIKEFIKTRKSEKISQNELSWMNNVNQTIVSRIERMKYSNIDTIINLLDSMGYRLSISRDYNSYNLLELNEIRSFLMLYNYFKKYQIANVHFEDGNLAMTLSHNNLYLKLLFKDLVEFKMDAYIIEFIDIKYSDNHYYFLKTLYNL